MQDHADAQSDRVGLHSTPDFSGQRRDELIGQMLVKAAGLSDGDLARGLHLQRQTGVRIGEALVALGYVRADHLATALAYKHGLAVADPETFEMTEALRILKRADWYREHRVVPLSANGTLRLATTDPLNEELLQRAATIAERPIEPVIATNRDIERLLHKFYYESDLHASTTTLYERTPENSAQRVLTRGQKVVLLAVAICIAVAFLISWITTLIVLNCILLTFYILTSLYKLYLVQVGWSENRTSGLNGNSIPEFDERELPIYTILVPLYREVALLPQIRRGIGALDWPRSKLDVRLLLEEDDTETIAAARKAQLPAYVTFVIVPKGGPRGKPKACNYGLRHARGEYVVIYDAEDIPEPNQLRRAYAMWRSGGTDLACIQCRLNFYNPYQNLMTRWFTAEYSMWFDLTLPGLRRLGTPIPLGGTSNHFRRDVLELLGAWDPYNVTEDADLGLRLFKLGLRTGVLESTTYEEANPAVGNWIRQRSRWTKGFAQTWLVHMRHPIDLWNALGWQGFWGFQLVLGGTVLSLLLNPIYWGLTVLWFVTRWEILPRLFPTAIYIPAFLALVFGNYVFVYLAMTGAVYRGYFRLVKYTFFSSLYWILMSIAAWKGVLQLISRPHYWEKTEHGLATEFATEGAAVTETQGVTA